MRYGAALTLTLGVACGAAEPRATPVELGEWSYTIGLDEALSTMRVRVCFDGTTPEAIAPIHRNGWRYVRNVDGLARTNDGLSTAGLPPDACVRYEVDLDAAARDGGGMNGAYRARRDLLASTAVWLWAPEPRAARCAARASFELPDGTNPSAFWPRAADGSHRLDERAFAFVAYAAFGRFESVEVAAPGACLHVAMLGGGIGIGPEATARAIGSLARGSSMLLGRFPVPDASVIVMPVPGADVPFGIVGRGTTSTVALITGTEVPERDLARAWVPVHEFSHLVTPYVAREGAWLSEGMATYYQEVLRARAGLQTAEQAWLNLDDGFRRGALDGTGRLLADESAQMMETAAFTRVYWAGAAILFAADVELRRRTNGASSLDRALARLTGARQPPAMSASELVAAIDEEGVLGPLVRRWLGSSEFPDLTATYAALGLERRGSELVFDGSADAAALRESILRPPAEMAPPGCAP